jgi:hypothetical protein
VDATKRDFFLTWVISIKGATNKAASGVGMVSLDINPMVSKNYEDARKVLMLATDLTPVLPTFLRDCHTLEDFWSFIHAKFPGALPSAPRCDWVRQQFLPVLDALENDRIPATRLSQEQQFFAPGKQHDGFVAVRDLISIAKESLLIADNFVDKTLWPLLTNLPAGSRIRVLTKKIPADFRVEAQNFSKQYNVVVEVRTTDALHDRFVLCDDQRCWHLGASIKDFGVRAAFISEVSSDTISVAVRKELEQIWQTAKPL